MTAPEKRYTSRGFRDFLDMTDAHGSNINVRQCSEIGEPKVWVFVRDPGDNPAANLTVEQAESLAAALTEFVREARDGSLP